MKHVPYTPLPYSTPQELAAAFEAGVPFLFVRAAGTSIGEPGCEPVLSMTLCSRRGIRALARDKWSNSGDYFAPDGASSLTLDCIWLALAGEQPLPAWMLEDKP